MCHHIRTADHERVVELAAEWEEWQREKEAETEDAGAERDGPVVVPADD